jgi:hypothetical protein
MTLYEKIMRIYPDLTLSDLAWGSGYIELYDDGEKEFIGKWEHPTYPRPTDEQLAAVEE